MFIIASDLLGGGCTHAPNRAVCPDNSAHTTIHSCSGSPGKGSLTVSIINNRRTVIELDSTFVRGVIHTLTLNHDNRDIKVRIVQRSTLTKLVLAVVAPAKYMAKTVDRHGSVVARFHIGDDNILTQLH